MSQTKLNPYIAFNGNAKEALSFYHKVLGGELKMMTWGEAPGTPPEAKDTIMHGTVEHEDITLMAADTPPGQPATIGGNVSLSLSGPDKEKMTGYFKGLSEGGEVTMPLEKQFWGDEFGMLKDKFGNHWMVNISHE